MNIIDNRIFILFFIFLVLMLMYDDIDVWRHSSKIKKNAGDDIRDRRIKVNKKETRKIKIKARRYKVIWE